jgi:hypothetical protein
MHGAIKPLLHTSDWRGAPLSNRDNSIHFTLDRIIFSHGIITLQLIIIIIIIPQTCFVTFNNRISIILNEELHGLYSSPSIVRVIKARRMRWAGHVARKGR